MHDEYESVVVWCGSLFVAVREPVVYIRRVIGHIARGF